MIQKLRPQNFGKFGRAYLENIVFRHLGAHRRAVVVGPKFGVDNSVIEIGSGKVLVATTDPLSFIPDLGPRSSAWLSIHLLASDLTTSGFRPQYGMFDFNLPPTMTSSDFSKYWEAFHEECAKLSLAIVGGHTGRYEGCDYTIIGGGFLYSIGPEDRYLTSLMAEDGDEIIVTKGVAIETTAILTRAFPRHVKKALGSRLFETAWGYLKKVTTVTDALTAVEVGVHEKGITAMHDATEGGFIAAVMELAAASGLGVELDLESIPLSQETMEICKLFKIDPLTSLSEGTLLITCKPSTTMRVLNRLNSAGISSQVVGQLSRKKGLFHASSSRGRVRLEYPRLDPYWGAYWRAVEKGWD